MLVHDIKYAKSGTLNIAYQVCGQGDEYLILIPGWVSNIEEIWNFPGLPEFIQAIAIQRKVVLFDKRGTGLSDRVNENDLPNLAVRIDDLRAIMEQEDIQQATIMGVSEGGPMALLFAATFPEKVRSLIIIGSYANWLKSSDNPNGVPMEIHEKALAKIDEKWAKGFGLKGFAPSWYGNSMYEKIWGSFLRKSASPNTAKALYKMNLKIDVRNILTEIKYPTLIVHRKGDKIIPVALGREMAENIPNAKMLELEGSDHFFWIDYDGTLKKEIVEFLGHTITPASPTTAIFTVLLIAPAIQPNTSIENHSINVQHEEFTLLSFRSPSLALKTAKTIANSNYQNKILMHTGVINMAPDTISGPVVEVLTETHEKIIKTGIWVSQICHQFLTGPQFNWREVKSLFLNNYVASSLNWYLLDTSDKRIRLENFLIHQDDKLKTSDIEALLNLKDYLDAHFLDNHSLKDLSYYSGLNNFKLKYGFKKLFNTPVKSYLKDLRLNFARQMLKETDLPIREIAHEIGYEQPASFSRAYQDKFGVSPQDE